MEGDGRCTISDYKQNGFQSTPSAWRATSDHITDLSVTSDFNPRPPHGGRQVNFAELSIDTIFQSTPSAWRATVEAWDKIKEKAISIHALRMEGDVVDCVVNLLEWEFQSTPSAWRATAKLSELQMKINPQI